VNESGRFHIVCWVVVSHKPTIVVLSPYLIFQSRKIAPSLTEEALGLNNAKLSCHDNRC
jgi:hypothetical protein